jgi:hypothetical protein
MTGSADTAPGSEPGQPAGHDLADAAPPASGAPAARDGVDTPDGDAFPGPAGGANSSGPFPGDGDEGGRYVPL